MYTAKEYMNAMYSVCGTKLIDTTQNNPYNNKEGHLRLAREIGCALKDFTYQEQEEIISSSYSIIYVRACSLKPLLSAKEWIEEMIKERE